MYFLHKICGIPWNTNEWSLGPHGLFRLQNMWSRVPPANKTVNPTVPTMRTKICAAFGEISCYRLPNRVSFSNTGCFKSRFTILKINSFGTNKEIQIENTAFDVLLQVLLSSSVVYPRPSLAHKVDASYYRALPLLMHNITGYLAKKTLTLVHKTDGAGWREPAGWVCPLSLSSGGLILPT